MFYLVICYEVGALRIHFRAGEDKATLLESCCLSMPISASKLIRQETFFSTCSNTNGGRKDAKGQYYNYWYTWHIWHCTSPHHQPDELAKHWQPSAPSSTVVLCAEAAVFLFFHDTSQVSYSLMWWSIKTVFRDIIELFVPWHIPNITTTYIVPTTLLLS